MDGSPDSKPEKKPRGRRSGTWPDVAAYLGGKIIDSGYLVPFCVLAIVGLLVWRMDAKGVADVLSKLIDEAWFCAGGWILSIVTTVVSVKLLRWRERMHQGEIERMAEVKRVAIQKHFELELPTSSKKNEPSA